MSKQSWEELALAVGGRTMTVRAEGWEIRAQQACVREAAPDTENHHRRAEVLREMLGQPHETRVAPQGVRRTVEGRER